jgi:hypothetical protein
LAGGQAKANRDFAGKPVLLNIVDYCLGCKRALR